VAILGPYSNFAVLGIAEYEVNFVFIKGVPANLDSTIEGSERVMRYPPLGRR